MTIMEENKEKWVKEGRELGATHVLDVNDSFSNEHYPVYVMPEDDVYEIQKEYTFKEMQVIYATHKIGETDG